MNFKEALLILKDCREEHAFHSLSFGDSILWVKVQGIPLQYNTMAVGKRALNKIGRVFYFDDASQELGTKEYLRALVWMKLKNPLIPGLYVEYAENRSAWIEFR